MSAVAPHRWKFIRVAGVDQVVIRSGADIVNIEHLDQKLWAALACPTRGLELDPRTLDLIDTDADGRIRAPELIEATRWVGDHFKNPDDLLRGGDEVPLEALRTDTQAGAALAVEAKRILRLIGKPDASSIALADLADLDKLLAGERFNGDGIVTVGATDDSRSQALIRQIVDTQGPATDRNGEAGTDRARAEAFFAEVQRLQAWQREGEADPRILLLGDRTAAAAEALNAVREKIDDFFVRCALAAYDPLSSSALNPPEEVYRALAPGELEMRSEAIARLPLATIRPQRALPLDSGLNPAWRAAIEALRRDAIEPVIGHDPVELTEADWIRLKDALAPCNAWLAARPEVKAGSLPMAEIMQVSAADQAAILALIEQDEAVADKNARVVELERLLRFQRDLVQLLNNFVSFAEFYGGGRGVFEAGTLYLDARSCDLTVHVEDPARHAVLAGLAKTYLAYCQCTRGDERMHIAAAFTAGDVDFLLVGRNGLFYDRQGRDWDATITKIIENPISIRQAFLAPYKKFSRMLEEQVAKRAAASDQGVARLSELATGAVPSAAHPAVPGDSAVTRRFDVGTVAALGVALGSISTVLVGIFAKFVDLGWWIPVGLLGIVLAISGPSMLIAWLKLRQRSLGPILDASGWAINSRMRVNVPLGGSLSKTARLPRNAERSLRDPLAERHRGAWLAVLLLVLALALAAAWRLEALDRWLPRGLQHGAPPATGMTAPEPLPRHRRGSRRPRQRRHTASG